ncbi:MAG: hypothetical protein HYS05_17770 [Acidobacteria bacterium]|nr:hypothetical protein [Acidobacteriota bacterium]
MPLAERPRRILTTVVTHYIATGEPVGSQTVVIRGALGLSSATIRNVLAELEDQGYVRQPHPSAGRVPTDLGYRSYVDRLLEARRPSRPLFTIEERLRLQAGMTPHLDDLLAAASYMLSHECHHVGFAMGPDTDVVRRPLYVKGTSSLLDYEMTAGLEFSLASLRNLLRIIEEKHRLIRLLGEYLEDAGLKVVIGAENRSPDLRECSLVAATYGDGDRKGTVGILGPTRMRYSRAISLVDAMAQAVSHVLETSRRLRTES